MPEFELSEIDKEGLEKGADRVQPEWWQIVEVSGALENGEVPSAEERFGGVALAPIELDHGILPNLMKDFLPQIFIDNPTMTTLITDEEGDHIIWSGVEHAEGGVYKWVERVDPEDEWAEPVNEKLAEDDYEGAYEETKKMVEEEFGVDLGLIKIAKPQFFIELEKTFEAAEEGEDLIGWIPQVMDFGVTIFEDDYINFYPEPYFYQFLNEVLEPMIKELNGDELEPILRKFIDEPPLDIIIPLKSRGKSSALRIKQDSDNVVITSVDLETNQELYSDDVKELAQNYRDEFPESDLVLALNVTEDLKNLLSQLMTDIPLSEETYAKIGTYLSNLLSSLGEDVWIEMNDNWLNLKNILDWAEELLDYDITELNLPLDMMMMGVEKTLSQNPMGIFITGENRELLTSIVADFTGDTPKLETVNKSELEKIFEIEGENAVSEAVTELPDEYGTVHPGMEVKIDEIVPIVSELKKSMKEPRRSPLYLMRIITYLGDILEKGINFSDSPYRLKE